MNCGDTGRERRGGVALRATPHLMSEMLWRRFEKSLVQTCLLYRNLFTRAVFLPFRTGRIIQQLSEVTEAYLATQLERGFSTLDFYKSLLI